MPVGENASKSDLDPGDMVADPDGWAICRPVPVLAGVGGYKIEYGLSADQRVKDVIDAGLTNCEQEGASG